MRYSYNGTLYSSGKQPNNNMDNSHEHYVEWKKPDTEEWICYYFTYMKLKRGVKM